MNIQDFNSKNRSEMVNNIMENKAIKEFNEIIDATNKTFPLFESVLDPIQKYRCPTLFGENNKEQSPKIKREAREFLLNIAEKFIKDIDIPGAKITEFFMIGSSLGYQYRSDADIDCDLRISAKKEDMQGKFSLIPKGIIYPGSSQPINIFLLCEDDPAYDFENHCENAYDLLENKWIKQGVLRNEYPIPYSYVAGVSEFIMDGIALQLQRADRHIQDVHKYISLDPEKVEISARERADAIADGINNLKIDADALNLSHHFLFRFDGEGFSGEEFRISIDYKASRKHYTINNLIYKYVDGFGYYDKVNAKIKEIWAVIEKAENELEKSKGSADEERDQERIQKEIIREAESVESVNDKTTVLNNLRSDIQDEYTAIKGYDAHADFAEKNGCSDIAKIIRDIRDEEKVHIGELEAVMKKYDKEFKISLADGGKEAEEILKESKKWNIKDFNNTEALGRELARLHAEKEKHLKADDMPSMYYENVDSHIKQLTNKMKEFNCKCKKINEADDPKKPEEKKIKSFWDWTPEDWAKAHEDADDDKNDLYNRKSIKESRLPEDGSDPQYGVPQQKKYPLYDKKHVEAAIKLFAHVDAEYEQQLARAIMAKMKKYGIPYSSVGKDNKLYKWIPEKYRKQEEGWNNYLKKYD